MATRRSAVLAAFLLLTVSASTGCSREQKIPASGHLGVYAINTTVDAQVAKYYLESYLGQGPRDDTLHKRIDAIHSVLGDRVPDAGELAEWSRAFSVDFGALLFARQVLAQEQNRELQAAFLRNVRHVSDGTARFPSRAYLVVFVPGYDYVTNGAATGADLAAPRRLVADAGFDTVFVALDPLGTVEENAAMVAAVVRAHPRRRMILVGPSSAGPAIHLAVGGLLSPAEARPVAAWVNLGGILRGSPILDWLQEGPQSLLFRFAIWAKGWRAESFRSMTRKVGLARIETLRVPEHTRTINYIGLSLSGDISDFARDKYSLMRSDGPNDGLALLPDMIAPDSVTIIAPDSDHFFAEDPAIDSKSLALLLTVLQLLHPAVESDHGSAG